MAIIKVKPTSPGRRGLQKVVTEGLHKGKPFAPLLRKKKQSAGRNHHGKITVRHIGGGHKHCLLYTSPSPRDGLLSRMPSSA